MNSEMAHTVGVCIGGDRTSGYLHAKEQLFRTLDDVNVDPRLGELEYSIDRAGGDYRNFETKPDPQGKPCADACQAETRCRAWTYVRPGYQGAAAHCYLKGKIPLPRHHPCCISGVIR